MLCDAKVEIVQGRFETCPSLGISRPSLSKKTSSLVNRTLSRTITFCEVLCIAFIQFLEFSIMDGDQGKLQSSKHKLEVRETSLSAFLLLLLLLMIIL